MKTTINMSEPSHLRHIGQNIKTLREYRGLKQAELANKAGIRPATLSEIENGLANPTVNTLVAIGGALNCYLDITFTPVS